VRAAGPPVHDFIPLAASGRRFRDPDVQRRAEEVSVWETLEAAVRVRARKPELRFVAVLEVPPNVVLTQGRGGHWGIPRGRSAEEIRSWVIEVRAIA
jgi:hypothetical protein